MNIWWLHHLMQFETHVEGFSNIKQIVLINGEQNKGTGLTIYINPCHSTNWNFYLDFSIKRFWSSELKYPVLFVIAWTKNGIHNQYLVWNKLWLKVLMLSPTHVRVEQTHRKLKSWDPVSWGTFHKITKLRDILGEFLPNHYPYPAWASEYQPNIKKIRQSSKKV